MRFLQTCSFTHVMGSKRVFDKLGSALTVEHASAEYALEAEGQHGQRTVRLVALIIPDARAPVQGCLLTVQGQLVHQRIISTGQHLGAHQKSFLNITLRGLFSSVTSPLVTYARSPHFRQLCEQASCLLWVENKKACYGLYINMPAETLSNQLNFGGAHHSEVIVKSEAGKQGVEVCAAAESNEHAIYGPGGDVGIVHMKRSRKTLRPLTLAGLWPAASTHLASLRFTNSHICLQLPHSCGLHSHC